MHLGLDFDNTLISYDLLFRQVAIEQGLIPNYIAPNKNAVRNYLRNIDKECTWTALQGEVYGGRILEAEPYPGMMQALQAVAKLKVPISIVSHKTKTPFSGKNWDLHLAARMWLDKNNMHSKDGPNISHEKIYFELTKQAKCKRILELGCTHYVDDLPEILEMLPDTIIKIHFSQDEQQASKNSWLLMRSWFELKDILGFTL